MTWDQPGLVNRGADVRLSPEALARRWEASTARVFWLDGRGRLSSNAGSLAVFAPRGGYDPGRHWYVGEADGVDYFVGRGDVATGETLRDLGATLSDLEYELAVTAVALANWHDREGFCPACGAPTQIAQAGWVRRCVDCATDHFPRHDPAMIVSVLDAEGRLLLAHQSSWPAGRYSVLAGFCEAGEGLEQCVHREVAEEVGIRLAGVRYLGSQAWPMPRSLMTAFVALASDPERLRPDLVEITDARWFSRADYAMAVEQGDITRPTSRSIAQWMIRRWADGDLVW